MNALCVPIYKKFSLGIKPIPTRIPYFRTYNYSIMAEKLTLEILLPASPQEVYSAWMDSYEHSACTGGEAEIDPQVGGKFTAWDGYISGETLALEPHERILQSWRTTEFPANAPDSQIELKLAALGRQCLLTLTHTQIPQGQGSQYESGWKEYYFEPMTEYFTRTED